MDAVLWVLLAFWAGLAAFSWWNARLTDRHLAEALEHLEEAHRLNDEARRLNSETERLMS
jgi:hypothetical protein